MSFSLEDLAQHSGFSLRILEDIAQRLPSGNGNFFTVETYRKKHGGVREIVKPNPILDHITKNLHRSFSEFLPYSPPDHVHGFVRGRSIVSNASQHLNKSCVLRVDLEDFFASIRSARLRAILEREGYDEKAADLCVKIVSIFDKLPIGLSTSPVLSNLAFSETDAALSAYAKSEGLSFTRYVDDLTFSGEIDDSNYEAIEEMLNDLEWSVNTRKTAFMRRGGPQYVTGLFVGEPDRPRIPRRIKQRMRWILHVVEKFGYEKYMTEFGGESSGMLPSRIRGWCYHIASVDPDLGYSLLRSFDDLLPEYYQPPGMDWYDPDI